MVRRRQLYEGKAKVIFEGPEADTVVAYFKDDATAFNNQKKGTITGKGVINISISEFLMMRLSEIGVLYAKLGIQLCSSKLIIIDIPNVAIGSNGLGWNG